jgi:hypothetical protein
VNNGQIRTISLFAAFGVVAVIALWPKAVILIGVLALAGVAAGGGKA